MSVERKQKSKHVLGLILVALVAMHLQSSMKTDDSIVLPQWAREVIYHSVIPMGYPNAYDGNRLEKIKEYGGKIRAGYLGQHIFLARRLGLSERQVKNRLDAWRLYLKLPQLYATF